MCSNTNIYRVESGTFAQIILLFRTLKVRFCWDYVSKSIQTWKTRKQKLNKKLFFFRDEKLFWKFRFDENQWFWKGFWIGHTAKNMKFEAKTRSKSSLNLSVGAQTLWSCSTHQFYNFWKFHQKILIFSEVINDFRFRPQPRFMPLCSRSHSKKYEIWI